MESNSPQPTHRIALIAGGLALGGSTTFLINFAGELVRRGISVEVFSFEKNNPLAGDFASQNIPVLCLDDRRIIFEDRLKQILRRLAAFQPTVVISTLGAVSFEVLRYLPKGIFRVGMGQSDDPSVYEMMRHYTPWMDLAAMVSQTMKQKAESLPEFNHVPVVYLPYGVPIDSVPPVCNLKIPLRILYLGRLVREQKRVQLFPEILQQLCASGMPFRWTIAGDGEERRFLEKNLKTISPDQTVTFTGPVAYAGVPALLKQHDIFLLASDYEGLPLSLLEAMSNGLVPVVSDLTSGISEVVNPNNGWLVPINEVSGYARAIIHLNGHRDELAAKAIAAHARVQKEFSIAAMTDRWLGVFPPRLFSMSSWPGCRRIAMPLTARNKFYFSTSLRCLRRLVIRFRK